MIEQHAVIIANEPGYAWVMPQDSHSCQTCTNAKSTCSSLSLTEWLRPKQQAVKVMNPVYAKVGEQVVVGLKSEAFLFYSLLAYALPLLGLLIAALLGSYIFSLLDWNSDIGAMLAGAIGLGVGLRLAHYLASWSKHLEHFQPVILRKQNEIHSIHFHSANLK
ncbi:MAG: SoxR reducing system RseC family protein [Thiofilum sp.]|uniref:SoxR reducing system RseC family protein n=1 Tax=Thiofilum sp. TaxID=2212733 RepID=UPI0025E2D1FE|nr:SoxR reducing system RseC family protein [Thiofilum sp.]MBK8455232.1 SoxR reducing system RseC family protein [Thiofilum sp.]